MAAVVFDVTPEELENSANKIASIEIDWIKEYRSIYAAVDELSVSYKGEASTQFKNRIDGYKNDFDAAQKALDEYRRFLKAYASDIKHTEDELKQQASQLSVGR